MSPIGNPDTIAPAVGIELRHMRYFLALFEELHFGRAADRLHMAQPPLSQAIRSFESKLGFQLFERTTRSVSPTEAGRVLAEETRRLLADLDLAVAAARRVAGVPTGLRVGCVHDLPIERLLRFFGALTERDPSLQPRVTHLPSGEQMRRLRRGELDLGVFHETTEHNDIDTEPLFVGEPMVALFAPGHPLAANHVLGPGDFGSEVLVNLSRAADAPLHDRIAAAIEDAGYRFRDVHEVGGAEARDLLPAVAQKDGVAFAPLSLGEDFGKGSGGVFVCRPLDPAPTMPDTVVGWHVNPPRWPHAILATVRQIARELVQEAV